MTLPNTFYQCVQINRPSLYDVDAKTSLIFSTLEGGNIVRIKAENLFLTVNKLILKAVVPILFNPWRIIRFNNMNELYNSRDHQRNL